MELKLNVSGNAATDQFFVLTKECSKLNTWMQKHTRLAKHVAAVAADENGGTPMSASLAELGRLKGVLGAGVCSPATVSIFEATGVIRCVVVAPNPRQRHRRFLAGECTRQADTQAGHTNP